MPTLSNGTFYTTATVITQSQSVTGSMVGLLVLASGSNGGAGTIAPADFTGLKDLAGSNIFPGTHLFIPPGVSLNMNFTSASLHTTSAPVMFFSI